MEKTTLKFVLPDGALIVDEGIYQTLKEAYNNGAIKVQIDNNVITFGNENANGMIQVTVRPVL